MRSLLLFERMSEMAVTGKEREMDIEVAVTDFFADRDRQRNEVLARPECCSPCQKCLSDTDKSVSKREAGISSGS